MTTFYTDIEFESAGTFVEGEVEVGTEFDLPAGTITRFRVPFPTPVGAVPATVVRLWNAGGTLVATVTLDTSTPDAWNYATPVAPISVAAGLYRASINTTRYLAIGSFFASPVTRGAITGTRGVFGSPTSAPTGSSTAALMVDIDFTVAAGSVGGAGTADAVSTAVAAGRVRVRAAGIAAATTTAVMVARVRVRGAGTAGAVTTATAAARVRVRGAGTAAAVSTGSLTVAVDVLLGPVVLQTVSLVRRLRTVYRR
jgi:hypothetical protein